MLIAIVPVAVCVVGLLLWAISQNAVSGFGLTSYSGAAREAVELDKELERRARAAAERRNADEAAAAAAERTAWVAAHGTDSQRARYAEALLPDVELLDAVRTWAFAPLSDLPRYERIERREIRHGDDCYESTIECDATASDDEQAEGLTENEYQSLARIRELAAACPLPATVEAREHWCRCERCESPRVTRQSALVTVAFAGRRLSREYAL